MKTGRIFWKSVYKTIPRNESFENMKDSWSTIQNKSGFVNHETKQIFLESGFVTTIRNESTFLRISYTNPASLIFYKKLFEIIIIIQCSNICVFCQRFEYKICLIKNHKLYLKKPWQRHDEQQKSFIKPTIWNCICHFLLVLISDFFIRQIEGHTIGNRTWLKIYLLTSVSWS